MLTISTIMCFICYYRFVMHKHVIGFKCKIIIHLDLYCAFLLDSYEAEQLLKEVDIHSVTGILKLYLRELPEALFTDQLYPMLFEAYNSSNGNQTRRLVLLQECLNKLPEQNHRCINFLLEHLIRLDNFYHCKKNHLFKISIESRLITFHSLINMCNIVNERIIPPEFL